MNRLTLRLILSEHACLNRSRFQPTQAQLAEADGTSLGWLRKIESGRKVPGFFRAVKLVFFLEIGVNALLKALLEPSDSQAAASKFKKLPVSAAAVNDHAKAEVSKYV